MLHGAPIGRWKFNLHGRQAGIGFFAQGAANGWWEFPDENGTVRVKGFVRTLDEGLYTPIGLWSYYRADGSILARGCWSWRSPVGHWEFFDRSGALVLRVHAADEISTRSLADIEPVPYILPTLLMPAVVAAQHVAVDGVA